MDARHAEEQFEENFRLFGNLNEKEKFNLYSGLVNIAKELQALRHDVRKLQETVDRMQSR